MIQPYLALAGRIKTELKELEPVLERAETLSQKARRSGDDDYLDGAALNVHGFYVGVEHILEEIARGFDGSAPTGPRWHQDLPIQMSAEIPGLRPPVLTRETRLALDEYRGFRHANKTTPRSRAGNCPAAGRPAVGRRSGPLLPISAADERD